MLRTTLVDVTRTVPAQLRESRGLVSATLNPAYIAGSGTSNYDEMTNKPTINGVELSGDLSLADLGICEAQESDIEEIFKN